MDFEGADDADAVPVADRVGVDGIDLAEPEEKRPESLIPGFRLEFGPDGRIAARAGEEPVDEGLEIKPRSPDDERNEPPAGDAGGRAERLPNEVGGRELNARIDGIDQMMGNAAHVRGRRFVRPDIEAPVDLDGIAVDDLAPEAEGQAHGDVGLAHARRAEEDREVPNFRFQGGSKAKGRSR
jgi:hypothetical protein